MNYLLVGINAKYIHTNLAIRYLYSITRNNFNVNFNEFTIKDQDEKIVKAILSTNPGMVAFSCYIWNIEKILNICHQLKQLDSSIKIVLGGPEVSYDIDYFLNIEPVDYIISGEGEYSFRDLLHGLENNLELNNIPQLHYKSTSGLFHNYSEYKIDFDTLPSPHRLVRDIDDLSKRIQYIESSRGCPYRCSYCLASLEKNVRQFNPERVKNEIRYLMSHGARVFKFLDRTFNMRKDFAIDIFQFIINEHTEHSVFQFEITGDLLDEEIITYLNTHAPKGLFRFEIGVQSTNAYTNKLILRTQNYQKLTRNIQLIQAGNKIDLHLDLIAGLPKEDYTSFQKTFNDVFSLKPHELQLGFLKMLRGTKIRQEASLYHYRYNETAPYEIIDHADISQSELQCIHLAEEILEKYYNKHRFDHAITYILDYLYPQDYYQFFEAFGIYWHKLYSNIDYQLHDLCVRLLDFIQIYHSEEVPFIQSLLIYDYLDGQKTKPKIWYKSLVTKEARSTLYQAIVNNEYLDTNLNQLYRYGLIENLQINPLTYKKEACYVLKMFEPDNKKSYILDQMMIGY